jgi:hypothetical protein
MVNSTGRFAVAAKVGLFAFLLAFGAGYLGSIHQRGFLVFPSWLIGLGVGAMVSLPSTALVTLLWVAPEERERRINAMLNRK